MLLYYTNHKRFIKTVTDEALNDIQALIIHIVPLIKCKHPQMTDGAVWLSWGLLLMNHYNQHSNVNSSSGTWHVYNPLPPLYLRY